MIRVLFVVLGLFVWFSNVSACDDITIEDVRKKVGMAFPIHETAEIIEREKFEGICAIFVKNMTYVLPVFMNKDIAIVGSMLKNGDNYTQKKVVALNKKILQDRNRYVDLDKYVAITYNSTNKRGEKNQVIYFISDPNCPYCNKVKKPLQEFAKNNNVEIKVIFYGISPQSEEKIIQAYCNKMTYDDYVKDKYPTKCNKDKYEEIKQKVLGELRGDIFVQGVPIFFNENKETVEGANIERLKDLLSK